MMGRQSGQMSMIILDLSELIPENHLLRKINQMISFDFIYDLVAPYYLRNSPSTSGGLFFFSFFTYCKKPLCYVQSGFFDSLLGFSFQTEMSFLPVSLKNSSRESTEVTVRTVE